MMVSIGCDRLSVMICILMYIPIVIGASSSVTSNLIAIGRICMSCIINVHDAITGVAYAASVPQPRLYDACIGSRFTCLPMMLQRWTIPCNPAVYVGLPSSIMGFRCSYGGPEPVGERIRSFGFVIVRVPGSRMFAINRICLLTYFFYVSF